MEEVVFKALLGNAKFNTIENFIKEVIDTNQDGTVTYEAVKESIFKLILYRFIKVDNSGNNCILKETNFYQAQELGSVGSWLAQQRAYSRAS
ncbi:hypothetical protein [Tenacibaculum amylolyticum]|uniref:hypothetical protein n=1 Tax=Tenacibaculum amylolyticum TaxID=104269 RepID=UPI00389658AB